MGEPADPIDLLLQGGGAVGSVGGVGGIIGAIGLLAATIWKLVSNQQARLREASAPPVLSPDVLGERLAGLAHRIESLEAAHREHVQQLRDLGLRTDARLDSIGQDVAKAGAEIGTIVIRQRGARG